jgi:hypothetical protein
LDRLFGGLVGKPLQLVIPEEEMDFPSGPAAILLHSQRALEGDRESEFVLVQNEEHIGAYRNNAHLLGGWLASVHSERATDWIPRFAWTEAPAVRRQPGWSWKDSHIRNIEAAEDYFRKLWVASGAAEAYALKIKEAMEIDGDQDHSDDETNKSAGDSEAELISNSPCVAPSGSDVKNALQWGSRTRRPHLSPPVDGVRIEDACEERKDQSGDDCCKEKEDDCDAGRPDKSKDEEID